MWLLAPTMPYSIIYYTTNSIDAKLPWLTINVIGNLRCTRDKIVSLKTCCYRSSDSIARTQRIIELHFLEIQGKSGFPQQPCTYFILLKQIWLAKKCNPIKLNLPWFHIPFKSTKGLFPDFFSWTRKNGDSFPFQLSELGQPCEDIFIFRHSCQILSSSSPETWQPHAICRRPQPAAAWSHGKQLDSLRQLTAWKPDQLPPT